jgi:hypothetical protein
VQPVQVAHLVVDVGEAEGGVADVGRAEEASGLGEHELLHFGDVYARLAPGPFYTGFVFISEFVLLQLALEVLQSVSRPKL